MKRMRSSLAMLALLVGVSPLAADPVIQRGIDTFVTPDNGTTSYDFAQNPIPAGFFCKGSKSFTGRVTLKGLPLATGTPGQLGRTDTVVERLDDAAFDANGTASTRIQFRALSLVSRTPIKTACGAFHVYVSLAGKQRVTAMRIQRTQENGGTFSAPLAVDARLTFIPVKPARNKAVQKLELPGSFTFPSTPLPWRLASVGTKKAGPVILDTDGDLAPDSVVPNTTNFFPGWSPDSATQKFGGWDCPGCAEWVCHYSGTEHEHCTANTPPGCLEAPIC